MLTKDHYEAVCTVISNHPQVGVHLMHRITRTQIENLADTLAKQGVKEVFVLKLAKWGGLDFPTWRKYLTYLVAELEYVVKEKDPRTVTLMAKQLERCDVPHPRTVARIALTKAVDCGYKQPDCTTSVSAGLFSRREQPVPSELAQRPNIEQRYTPYETKRERFTGPKLEHLYSCQRLHSSVKQLKKATLEDVCVELAKMNQAVKDILTTLRPE